MREKTIEQYLIKQVKSVGGSCYKWSSPSQRGVPDRIAILGDNIYFIELKRPDGKLRALQEHFIKIMKIKHNIDVEVLSSKKEVDQFINEETRNIKWNN
jgi:hypothetical protein